MTPEDVPATITADVLFPWLHAIAPPVEPVASRPAGRTPAHTARETEPLRPAA